jgi:hypothetical protein
MAEQQDSRAESSRGGKVSTEEEFHADAQQERGGEGEENNTHGAGTIHANSPNNSAGDANARKAICDG